ncbi:terpene synthase family protein [Streptomyces sp. NPDC018610]|uniref:terpene synthase family protein n=1 Tax=Streptomyces sp. NPDC018610 TaxID=3365049 RepID=UPI0037B6FF44
MSTWSRAASCTAPVTYPSPDAFLYALSRLCARFPDAVQVLTAPARRALEQSSGGSSAACGSVLEIALRTLAADNLDVTTGQHERRVRLAQTQRPDGLWPASAYYRMGRFPVYFGSSYLTTVFAMSALVPAATDPEGREWQPRGEVAVHDFGIRVPDRFHPQMEAIGERLAHWATNVGLATGATGQARLRRAGFHQVAARILPDEQTPDVELFAQWVVWLFHLDDSQDEGAMGHCPDTVHAAYTAITAIIDGQSVPAGGAAGSPAVAALTHLWPRTMAGMSPAWRRRIRGHIHRHRDAFLTQITHRRQRTLPTPEEYPGPRRDANGMFMYDLVEVACRTEIPETVAAGPAWKELCTASSDITAWCNDIYSLARGRPTGNPPTTSPSCATPTPAPNWTPSTR